MESVDIIVRYVEGYGYLPVVRDNAEHQDLYIGEFRETPLIAFYNASITAEKYINPVVEEEQE